MSGPDNREDFTLGLNVRSTRPRRHSTSSRTNSIETTKSAAAAGEAVGGAGVAAAGAATNITAAAAAWDRVARRNDEVTAAAYRLKSAQEELARVTAIAARAMAEGSGDADQVARVIQKLTDNVDRLKASLVEVRDRAGSIYAGAGGMADQSRKRGRAAHRACGVRRGDLGGFHARLSRGCDLRNIARGIARAVRQRFSDHKGISRLNSPCSPGHSKSERSRGRRRRPGRSMNSTPSMTKPQAPPRRSLRRRKRRRRQHRSRPQRSRPRRMRRRRSRPRTRPAAPPMTTSSRRRSDIEAVFNNLNADLAAGRINQAQYDIALDKTNQTMASSGRVVTNLTASHRSGRVRRAPARRAIGPVLLVTRIRHTLHDRVR